MRGWLVDLGWLMATRDQGPVLTLDLMGGTTSGGRHDPTSLGSGWGFTSQQGGGLLCTRKEVSSWGPALG